MSKNGALRHPAEPQNHLDAAAEKYDDKAARLQYVKEMAGELAKIAKGVEAQTLSYLLNMAALEADENLKHYQFSVEFAA